MQQDTDWLIEGLTDMPESDVRELAAWFAVPVHVAQGIVWLTEMRDREVLR